MNADDCELQLCSKEVGSTGLGWTQCSTHWDNAGTLPLLFGVPAWSHGRGMLKSSSTRQGTCSWTAVRDATVVSWRKVEKKKVP